MPAHCRRRADSLGADPRPQPAHTSQIPFQASPLGDISLMRIDSEPLTMCIGSLRRAYLGIQTAGLDFLFRLPLWSHCQEGLFGPLALDHRIGPPEPREIHVRIKVKSPIRASHINAITEPVCNNQPMAFFFGGRVGHALRFRR